MPTYKPGTRQWAEQELERLSILPRTEETLFLLANISDSIEMGIYPDDPNPVYTQAELEAMGQGGLF